MGRLLFFVFLVVPLIEIALFISIGQAIGLWPTLFGVVVTALIGSAIIRKQGISLIDEIRQVTAAGAMPAKQLAEGMMLGISGALLLTPGYFTDAVGFILLVPRIRIMIYEYVKSKITVVHNGMGTKGPRTPPDNDDFIDLDRRDWRDDD